MLHAVLMLGGAGFVLSIVLGIAAKVFYVKEDPKVVAVEEGKVAVERCGRSLAGLLDGMRRKFERHPTRIAEAGDRQPATLSTAPRLHECMTEQRERATTKKSTVTRKRAKGIESTSRHERARRCKPTITSKRTL